MISLRMVRKFRRLAEWNLKDRKSAADRAWRALFSQVAQLATKRRGNALQQLKARRGVAVLKSEESFGTGADGHGQLLDAEAASYTGLPDTIAYVHDGRLARLVFDDKSYEALVGRPAAHQNLAIMTTFAERLEKIMATTGLRKNQFAELVGVRDRQITRWLDGTEPANRETLIKIANVADCSFEWLMSGEGDSGLRAPEVAGSWAAMVRGYKRMSKLSRGMSDAIYQELLRIPGDSKKSPMLADVHDKREELEERRRPQSHVIRESNYPNLNAVLERVNPLPADRDRVLSIASSSGDLSEAEWLKHLKMPKANVAKIRRR